MMITFTGTQRGMTQRQKDGLRTMLRIHGARFGSSDFILLHGGCVGADDEADNIANDMRIDRWIFPSTIDAKRVDDLFFLNRKRSRCAIEPPEEPLLRNRKMVEIGQIVIAAPSSADEVLRSGTWATVRYARKLHRQVMIFEP